MSRVKRVMKQVIAMSNAKKTTAESVGRSILTSLHKIVNLGNKFVQFLCFERDVTVATPIEDGLVSEKSV